LPLQSVPGFSTCRVRLQTGTDAQGNPVFASRSYSRIKPDVLDQDIYDVITAVLNLQQHQVVTINRQDNSELLMA